MVHRYKRVMMKRSMLVALVGVVVSTSGSAALADTTFFGFSGGTVSGSGILTYGPSSITHDPSGAFAVTGITGTFSDSSLGLSNLSITGLVAINPVSPYPGTPFPGSFSSFAITNPTPPATAISYDNLFYPGGSPIVCPDYPGYGGFLDVYGLLFKLSNGYTVNFWSNGAIPNVAPLSYGVSVVDGSGKVVHTQDDVMASTPEPTSIALLAAGLVGVVGCRRKFAASQR